MRKFRSKPGECAAEQWLGEGSLDQFPPGAILYDGARYYVLTAHNQRSYLEHGDWVIVEPNAPGRYYPCKPDVFSKRWGELHEDNVPNDEPTATNRFQAIADFADACRGKTTDSELRDRFEYIIVIAKAGIAEQAERLGSSP